MGKDISLGGGCGFLILCIFVVIMGAFAISAEVVNPGQVGIVTTFGVVDPQVRNPGVYVLVPISQAMRHVDTRVQPHPFKEIDAASAEMQTVKLTGMLNYHLDPAKVAMLYQTVGLDLAEKVIDPAFNDYIKEVVPQYKVIEVYPKRDEIRAKARTALSANLSRYGIVVDDIYISNISFSDEYQTMIEQKQTAQQQTEKETQLLAAKKVQADQIVVAAQAEADASVVRAKGEAQANKVRAESLSPVLNEYLKIQRWDGKLPTVTGSVTPMIDVTAKP